MPLLHREHAGLCHMEGNKNCFPPLTKVNNMAALPIALLRLTFLLYVSGMQELKSRVLEVHGILAQTVVFFLSLVTQFGLSVEPPLG